MNTQATNGKGQADDPSTTIGVGRATSGQSGATPSHETQQETGGSGGEQLTGNQDAGAGAGGVAGDTGKVAAPAPPPVAGRTEAPDSSMQSGARGAFDTRPDQGGGTGTGIGSPESGANQSEADLPPATGEGRTP